MILVEQIDKKQEYLECEKRHVFLILMGVAGFFGGFTYSIRGGVFCNAQTANIVLFGMALGNADWARALYLLIPMGAYFLGAAISEILPLRVRKFHILRWDTLFILFEMLIVVILGLIPESAPVQISQILINFICSMQYNTFRQARGIPMATTFATNHWRQVAINLVKVIRHHGTRDAEVERLRIHSGMILMLILGAMLAAILCRHFLGHAIFVLLLPLGMVLIDLIHADLVTEKDELEKVPHGH